jgi:hypothetical protein
MGRPRTFAREESAAHPVIAKPGDRHEREADRIADSLAEIPGHASARAHTSGEPLDRETRAVMESRLGHDFSKIRIHSDMAAAASARALDARAYTFGRDIVFGAGELAPETSEGRRLLAHELVHAVQQRAAPLSGANAVSTSAAAESVQRQPANPQPATPPTPAENIKAALAFLANVQPTLIHKALSAAPVDGASVQVFSLAHTLKGKPVTSVFNLQVKVAKLAGFVLARFDTNKIPVETADTRTFSMTITVSDKAAAAPAQTLARDLFHEGMHMQLFIDRMGPSWMSTAYLTRMDNYLNTARKSPNYDTLLKQLTAFIKKNVKRKTAKEAAEDAQQIIEQIIEEKYVMDALERTELGSKSTVKPTSTEKQRQYRSAVSRWLTTYLDDVGAGNQPADEVSTMIGLLVTLWNAVDAGASPPPLHPTAIGMTPDREPDLLAAPDPLLMK